MISNAVGVGTINRFRLFDALRELFDTKGVNETRVYPDRIVVYRFCRDDENRLIISGDEPLRTVETYWLVGHD